MRFTTNSEGRGLLPRRCAASREGPFSDQR
jgi:hypothetical protein